MSMTSIGSLQIVLIALLMLAGTLSAYLYWRQRRRLDALLVMCAALPLAVLLLQVQLPRRSTNAYVIDSTRPMPSINELRRNLEHADRIILRGDGLFQSQWQDLPVRPLEWQADGQDVEQKSKQKTEQKTEQKTIERLQLRFPQRLTFGRLFKLEVRRASNSTAAWRVQLLAENQQVLAEQTGTGQSIQLSWLPPVAQRMVLQAKVWNEQAQLIDQGPIPLEVIEIAPLQVEGRFAAPSFDTQSLNQLLLQSSAQLDWQTQLGKGILRKEMASASLSDTNLLIQDAAYFEQLSAAGRQQLLSKIAAGASLIILGGNAQQATLWAQHLGLQLVQARKENEAISSSQGSNHGSHLAALNLSASSWQPRLAAQSAWQRVDGQDWLVKREWQAGHILWLGAADWHQAMISDAQKLKLWWQSVLDASGVRQYQDWIVDLENDTASGGFALTGHLQRLCARGLDQHSLMLEPGQQKLLLRPVAGKVDAHCAGFWPSQNGWYEWQTIVDQDAQQMSVKNTAQNTVKNIVTNTKQSAAKIAASGALYVFQANDWLSWQKQQKRDATRAYAMLLGEDKVESTDTLPTWPLLLFSMLASLALWRREQASASQ